VRTRPLASARKTVLGLPGATADAERVGASPALPWLQAENPYAKSDR
jgi:hypothetical protein